jgi:hypothetical protein
MNLNLSRKADYDLQARHTNELIKLYGVHVKLLITEKINQDTLVFGDYSHLKTNSTDTYEIYGLPEVMEEWDDVGVNFSEFGLVNTENIRLFFSRKSIDTIFTDIDANKGFSDIIGNLIVLPNNKIMEISDIEYEVPGINNLFTQADRKNVYKFTLISYANKLVNEINSTDIVAPDSDAVDYTTLETYFDELSANDIAVDTEAEVTTNTETGKVVMDTTEDSVFGRF